MTAPVSRTGATDREVEAVTEFGLDSRVQLTDKGRAYGGWRQSAGGDYTFPLATFSAGWDAAVASATPTSGQLREFAEFVVSLDDDDPESPGRQARRTVTLTQLIDRARAALLAEQPGTHTARELAPWSLDRAYPFEEHGVICSDCGWLVRGPNAHPDAEAQHRQHLAEQPGGGR